MTPIRSLGLGVIIHHRGALQDVWPLVPSGALSVSGSKVGSLPVGGALPQTWGVCPQQGADGQQRPGFGGGRVCSHTHASLEVAPHPC